MSSEQLEAVRLKFTSGNGIPVERASITRTEWDAIETLLAARSQSAAPRVVSDERTDTLHQLAFEIGDTDEAGTGYSFSMEQFDEFSHAALASVQRDDELPEGYGPPEGYELAEHLPGIWQYEYQESGKKMVSLTSWNNPILACIAAWKDKLAAVEEKHAALESIVPTQQPAQPSVPVEEKIWLCQAYIELHRLYGDPTDGNKVGLDILSSVSSALRRIGVEPNDAKQLVAAHDGKGE